MSKTVSKIVIVLMVFGVFAPLVWANQLGLTMGYQTKTDFKYGIFYAFDLSQNLRLQSEVYYTQREYELEIPNEWKELPEQRDHTMDTVKYIEVPLLLKYTINLSGPIKPVLFGGGYAMFKVGERLAEINVLALMVPLQYNKVDGGIVMGAGFELAMRKIALHVDFRANFGFGRLRQVDYSIISPELASPVHNRKSTSVSILAGISF